MKKLLLFAVAAIALLSCNKEPQEQSVKIEKIEAQIPEEDTFPYDTLQGMYMADFGGSPIRIIINYASGKNAIGYNIHKGLQRNIMGKVTRSGDSVQLVLAEPGDNKYDGVFTINFVGIDKAPKGTWEANDKSIPGQTFTLKKIEKQKDQEAGELDVTNFASNFSQMSDSIGEYHFQDDGLVILKYYPDNDEDWDKQQFKELKGSWELNGDKVTINWEPNKIFKGNRLDLEIVESEYEYEPPHFKVIGSKSHYIYSMWYW